MPQEASPVSSNTSAAPDWAAVDREILCPLCDYNLRGLSESRCPECGHQFDWNELLTEGSHVHPFLFEHRADRPVRSWIQTFRASRVPLRFWQSVQPRHRVALSRLYIYGATVVAVTVVIAMLLMLGAVQNVIDENREARARLLSWYSNPSSDGRWAPAPGQTAQQAVDQANPEMSIARAFYEVAWTRAKGRGYSRQDSFFGHSMILLLTWPILTALTMLVFRVSFRQAGIRFGHIARCVIYTADSMVLATIMFGVGEVFTLFYRVTRTSIQFDFLSANVWWCGLLGILLLRLLIASQLYLRITSGAVMMLASQFMVWLAMLKMSMYMEGY